ncbi:RNA polymerase sigma factor [Anoxybacter fermentans]|nr:sigma-70 family RNA polymerase sigma factor [Anoxybacter fermentans]
MCQERDIYLVKRTLAGDDEAFARLVDCYKNRIFQLIYCKIQNKEDIEDLAQEVFLRIYKSLKKFDQKRKFSTWIYTIANNLCIDYLRKKRLQAVSLDAPLFPSNKDIYIEIPDEEYAPELILQKTDEQKRIIEAVESLAEEYKLVIKLRHFKGYSYKDIGKILDLPIGTIKSRIYRARKKLKDILFKEGGGEKNGLSKCL